MNYYRAESKVICWKRWTVVYSEEIHGGCYHEDQISSTFSPDSDEA